ncbi:hypothetical protein NDU88_003091 [Pleurodeles waltl]|uniref:Uncharacterized protein n=1 Tax=Pleurodeles waltl TaxID=8319 RepID=A0AAV7UEY7_PLEWA|nr:hypothetical protein NDU88_003091 [Pleurodeles waltl]
MGHLPVSRKVHAASATPAQGPGSLLLSAGLRTGPTSRTPLLLPCLVRAEIGAAATLPCSARESQPHRWLASRGFLRRFLSAALGLTSARLVSVAARGSSPQFPATPLHTRSRPQGRALAGPRPLLLRCT